MAPIRVEPQLQTADHRRPATKPAVFEPISVHSPPLLAIHREHPLQRDKARILSARDMPQTFQVDEPGTDLGRRHAANLAGRDGRGLGSVTQDRKNGAVGDWPRMVISIRLTKRDSDVMWPPTMSAVPALFGEVRRALLRHGGQQRGRVGAAPKQGMRVALFTEEQRTIDHVFGTLRLSAEMDRGAPSTSVGSAAT